MFIKLTTKFETPKACQLTNDAWIPKSVLDSRGLKHPYYVIEPWWLNMQVENVRLPLSVLNDMGRKRKTTEKDIENSKHVLLGLKDLVVSMREIPEDIRNYWGKYWKSAYNDLGSSTPDFEPRMWGNDCFEGEMSTWFD